MTYQPAQTIQAFNDLVTLFISIFATNKAKRLEVVDLFDIEQEKGENLKGYLAMFNNAMSNDSLALRKPSSMEEIRTQAEKYIEAEEDLIHQLEAEHQLGRHRAHARVGDEPVQFNHLKAKRAQILREVYHTQLLDFPPTIKRQLGFEREEWCNFHRTHGHTTKDWPSRSFRSRKRPAEMNSKPGNEPSPPFWGDALDGKIASTRKRHTRVVFIV
ncbi:hypothetical protein CR513_32293, partial [Mucuna pruriens]